MIFYSYKRLSYINIVTYKWHNVNIYYLFLLYEKDSKLCTNKYKKNVNIRKEYHKNILASTKNDNINQKIDI